MSGRCSFTGRIIVDASYSGPGLGLQRMWDFLTCRVVETPTKLSRTALSVRWTAPIPNVVITRGIRGKDRIVGVDVLGLIVRDSRVFFLFVVM